MTLPGDGSVSGGDDDRVLLKTLSSLDRAYSAKYEKQLEEAERTLTELEVAKGAWKADTQREKSRSSPSG